MLKFWVLSLIALGPSFALASSSCYQFLNSAGDQPSRPKLTLIVNPNYSPTAYDNPADALSPAAGSNQADTTSSPNIVPFTGASSPEDANFTNELDYEITTDATELNYLSYLIDFSSIERNLEATSFSQEIKTVFGPIILKSADLKELLSTIAFFGKNEDTIKDFVNGIFVRRIKLGFINPDFLNWVLLSYDTTHRLSKENFTGSTYGYQPGDLTPQQAQNIQRREIRKEQDKLRQEFKTSPLRFKSFYDLDPTPANWLSQLEIVWIYYILMREPIVRKIISSNSLFENYSAMEINDVVFFISAFPELMEHASDLHKFGFKPGDYYLTDGMNTKSAVLRFARLTTPKTYVKSEPEDPAFEAFKTEIDAFMFTPRSFPWPKPPEISEDWLMSTLILEKDFMDLREASYAMVLVGGNAFYRMTEDQITGFQDNILDLWNEFRALNPRMFKGADIDIILALEDRDFRIELESPDDYITDIMVSFYKYLLDHQDRLQID